MWAAAACAVAAVYGAYASHYGPRQLSKNSPEALGFRMKFIEPSIMDEPWFHPVACAGVLSLFIAEAAAIFV